MAKGEENHPAPRGDRRSEADTRRISEVVSGAIASGLPLAPGLRATAAELPLGKGRLRHSLVDLADQIDSGESVDEALRLSGTTMPAHLRSLVAVSARTGRPGEALGRFAEFATLGDDLRWKLWASLAYPILSITLASGLFIFICVALVGNFEAIYRDFGVPLPTITLALITIARPFYNSWDILLEGLAGLLVFSAIFWIFVDKGTRQGLIGSIPVVGGIFRNISMAEFCHLLPLLLESEMPLPEAVRLGGGAVRDKPVERAADAVARDVAEGMSLADAVAKRPIFPHGLSRVLRWAENSRSLPESLRMIAEMFASSARAQAEFAGTFLSVLAVMSILFGASMFAIGLLVPMITLITKLSG